MSSLRPSRWTNQGLPQLLQFATFLLYFTAGSAVLSRLINFGAPTPYYLLGLKLFGVRISTRGVATSGGAAVLEVFAIAGLIYAGAMIASSKRLGWHLGISLAGGLVAIPVLLFGFDLLRSDFIIGWLFDVALFVMLVHPTSREYQKVWFH